MLYCVEDPIPNGITNEKLNKWVSDERNYAWRSIFIWVVHSVNNLTTDKKYKVDGLTW